MKRNTAIKFMFGILTKFYDVEFELEATTGRPVGHRAPNTRLSLVRFLDS